MSYVALYRKYRPQKFSDMVGQEHITKILKNQIVTGKVSHAYIFSGTRGTGKTTAAKIFARGINCLNPKDGEPCNECEACKSIIDGNTTDVVEMDAASNNSVENIRSIRQEVAYSTTGLKYKVYIIDEAHMLSTSAFNALLKTLEEPPENVVFILATTEEHKILPTILSRCIRFEFKKIGKDEIKSRLYTVLKDLNVDGESEAMDTIASLADGGMRDALSILERCITSGEGKVTKESVEKIIGVVPKEKINEIVKEILEYNVVGASKVADEIIETGKDLRNINAKLIEEFMNLLIAKSSGNFDKLEENIKEILKNTTEVRLHEIIKHLSKLDDDLRQSNNISILFKAKILELTTDILPFEEEKLINKIAELELKVEKLEKVKPVIDVKEAKKDVVKESEAASKAKKVEENKTKSKKEKLKDFDKIMKKVVDSDNLKLYSALTGANAFVEDDTLVLATENSFAYSVLNKESSKKDLKNIVNEELNNDFNIRIDYIKEEKNEVSSEFENLFKDSDVPFEIVD